SGGRAEPHPLGSSTLTFGPSVPVCCAQATCGVLRECLTSARSSCQRSGVRENVRVLFLVESGALFPPVVELLAPIAVDLGSRGCAHFFDRCAFSLDRGGNAF